MNIKRHSPLKIDSIKFFTSRANKNLQKETSPRSKAHVCMHHGATALHNPYVCGQM